MEVLQQRLTYLYFKFSFYFKMNKKINNESNVPLQTEADALKILAIRKNPFKLQVFSLQLI